MAHIRLMFRDFFLFEIMVQWHEIEIPSSLRAVSRQTTTIQHSRSQTCYFTLFYVLTFGFVALTWKIYSLSARFILYFSLHLSLL